MYGSYYLDILVIALIANSCEFKISILADLTSVLLIQIFLLQIVSNIPENLKGLLVGRHCFLQLVDIWCILLRN